MNISSELNLARKWRPTSFEAIVGQDLTVRLLKNSLFKRQFFPVYLLAGQRGCGKTTTGRIFAAAVNCSKLEDFSQNPSQKLPCGACLSCETMKAGTHPDFIEIDAASHTGVDNVRQIIEATSFLPHMGRKKIYLIDEAHMLSKAAFNAFLKILEEPPKTVLFMMATTDAHKIIDTVRSRCFQLFFDPVDHAILTDHLMAICGNEEIVCEREALEVIARESEGSVRDALNLIERVRLAHETITKKTVMSIFGSLEDEAVMQLLRAVAAANPAEFLAIWKRSQLESHSAVLLWKKIFECFRACILIQFAEPAHAYKTYVEELHEILAGLTAFHIMQCMEEMYKIEQQFLKTTTPHALVEMVLLKLCMRLEQREAVCVPEKPVPVQPMQEIAPRTAAPARKTVEHTPAVEKKQSLVAEAPQGPTQWWHAFVTQIDTIGDPVFASMIKEGKYRESDAIGTTWQVSLPKKFDFFKELVEKHAVTWQALLKKVCQKDITIHFQFNLETAAPSRNAPTVEVKPRVAAAPKSVQTKNSSRPPAEKPVDVSDATKWEKTHSLLELFPGTVSEIKGSSHE